MVEGISEKQAIELDSKDIKIINCLWENGRYTVAEVSNKTGIQRDTVMYRIKKLKENKVITSFSPVLNPPAVGFPNLYIVMLKLKIVNDSELKEFQNKLVKITKVVHVSRTIGKYDFYTTIVSKDSFELYRTIEEIKQVGPNLITEIEHLQIIEEPKYDDFRGVLSELKK